MDNSELYHWGIPGMRWGVRRYQNADGTWTNAGKKKREKEYAADHPETLEEKKKRVIDSHDPKTVYENRYLFDANEIATIQRQLTAEDIIRKMIKEEESAGKKFVDKLSDKMDTFTKGANAVKNGYDSLMKIKGVIDAISGVDKNNKNNNSNSKNDSGIFDDKNDESIFSKLYNKAKERAEQNKESSKDKDTWQDRWDAYYYDDSYQEKADYVNRMRNGG